MWWIIGVVALVVVGALAGPPPTRRRHPRRRAEPPEDYIFELSVKDPVQALARYGTAANAERPVERGHGDDLTGLGWPPEDR